MFMKKIEKKTSDKIERLSKSIDIKVNKKKEAPTFKTKEVIFLLLITATIGLLMGGLVTYKVIFKSENTDEELQSFINNYDYVVNNYYGSVDKEKLIDAAIAGMLNSLDKNSSYVGGDDTNFSIYLEGSYTGTGIQVYNDENNNIVIYKVFENSTASKAGLKSGDIVVKLDGKDTTNMTVSDFSKLVKKKKSKFSLTYKRNDKEKTVKLKVGKVELPSVSSKVIEKENKKIGYIKISIFASNTYTQFKKEFENLENKKIDGLIIDLRNNSGGHLTTAEDILSLFLDSTHPIYQIKTKEKQTKYYSNGKKTKAYPITMLVNSSSASASELVTSALKEQYGATVVGEKTYGKGTVQELQTLPDGQQYKLTTKSWLTSKGRVVDKKGIEPDLEVALDEKYNDDPKEENDNQLTEALNTFVK